MPRAIVPANIGTIEIEYETLGSPLDPTILLIMGFTAQLIAWSDKFCQMLVDQGFHVIRFDNRDCGLSTKLDGVAADPMAVMSAFLENKPTPAVPYTLSDMALDAVGLLDHLGIDAAHIVGASMGGMIAQTLVIEHPHRARSLTSVMSVSGNLDYGAPTPEAAVVLLEAPTGDRQSYINDSVKARVWHSRRYFDEEKIKTDYARSYDRSFYPEGASRQLAAIYASGSREDALTKIALPTLVIHGTDDTLLQPSGGQRTADLIPGSTLFMVADMGHDMPEPLLPLLTSVIGSHVKLAEWHRTTGHAIR